MSNPSVSIIQSDTRCAGILFFVIKALLNINVEIFSENNKQLKAVNYFCKKLHQRCLTRLQIWMRTAFNAYKFEVTRVFVPQFNSCFSFLKM